AAAAHAGRAFVVRRGRVRVFAAVAGFLSARGESLAPLALLKRRLSKAPYPRGATCAASVNSAPTEFHDCCTLCRDESSCATRLAAAFLARFPARNGGSSLGKVPPRMDRARTIRFARFSDDTCSFAGSYGHDAPSRSEFAGAGCNRICA